MNIREIICPRCREWWVACPCCSVEFCPRCGALKNLEISSTENPADFQREYERFWGEENA